MISLIACVDIDNGIGLNGTIPWSLKPDMKYFKEMTTGGIVIMGRKTWESIGSKPLPNRTNIVITSNPSTISSEAFACVRFEHAIELAKSLLKPIFIIGGYNIYKEAIPLASVIYLTRINKCYGCDTTFPYSDMRGFDSNYGIWLKHKDLKYRFETHIKSNITKNIQL